MNAILTPFQIDILKALARDVVFRDFYLTGGTALSAFYLEHRLSEDLDLFTDVQQNVARAEQAITKIAETFNAEIQWGKRIGTLFECSLVTQKEKLEMDFALDMPGRLKPIIPEKAFGMNLDNMTDISCNKLSALYQRNEPKDYVDIYFIIKEIMPLQELWTNTQRKYPSLDLYGLALTFFKVKAVDKLPQMIKPLSLEELKSFFIGKAEEISKRFG